MQASGLLALTLLLVVGCANPDPAGSSGVIPEAEIEIVLSSEVEWEQLNPARGDKSPQAGTIWGDRKAAVPTGFLAKFADGFSSPPHIHNATYRAVVISGLIHNDDPAAAEMWMPAGSFWTQPKGEVHITAARGDTNVALVEIDQGPYLVLPPEDAFDSGERPVNVDASNLVWVDAPGFAATDPAPELAYLWGRLERDEPNGTFIKLPSGFVGEIHSEATVLRAVVIQGRLLHRSSNGSSLDPGSYFCSKGEAVHGISAERGEDVILYVRSEGSYELAGDR